MTASSPYLEGTNYWTSVTRRGQYPRGMGKWMLPRELFAGKKERKS